MAKRDGTYKGEKRRKELSRQKKQEGKRQRSVIKKFGSKEEDEIINPEGGPEGIENDNEKVSDVSGSA